MLEPRKPIQYFQLDSEESKSIAASVIVETPVSLTVNGEVWVSMMCTPILLEEMAIGFLFNEGIIDAMDEISDVRLCEHGDNVDIWLTHAADKPSKWTRTSGCSGGMTAVDSITRPRAVSAPNGYVLPASGIGHLVEMLFESQDLYRETGGVHTSALTDGERILLSAEDIGRHNTLDKLAGMCLRQNVWPSRRILMTTGRISSEMLQKAVRLGAGILISRTSPSSLSIELAEKWGITLIGYARRNRFNLYAHPERIMTSVEQTS
ncbi:MAG: formate dehydrogenase accessory sulfurtransferase FdhD [Chloroflexi bacterium]|nr:formate dehydrogenase accessory sulfurtransferase FdhD [Chloroflexota bacterium]